MSDQLAHKGTIIIVLYSKVGLFLYQHLLYHRVFKGIAQRGKCSMGWFFGFKLHLICNEK